MANNRQVVEVTLEYHEGADAPEVGVYRRFPVAPTSCGELGLAIRDHPEAQEPDVFPENPSQLQVHLIGTAKALEDLGKYLIALARLDTVNPEPSESLDEVRNVDGGTIRLIPRRVSTPPVAVDRSDAYRDGFKG